MTCICSSWRHCHPIFSCCIKIQIGLTVLVPAYTGCPGKEAIKRASVSSVAFILPPAMARSKCTETNELTCTYLLIHLSSCETADDSIYYLGNSKLKILLSDVNPSFPQCIHASFCAYALHNHITRCHLIDCHLVKATSIALQSDNNVIRQQAGRISTLPTAAVITLSHTEQFSGWHPS